MGSSSASGSVLTDQNLEDASNSVSLSLSLSLYLSSAHLHMHAVSKINIQKKSKEMVLRVRKRVTWEKGDKISIKHTVVFEDINNNLNLDFRYMGDLLLSTFYICIINFCVFNT